MDKEKILDAIKNWDGLTAKEVLVKKIKINHKKARTLARDYGFPINGHALSWNVFKKLFDIMQQGVK